MGPHITTIIHNIAFMVLNTQHPLHFASFLLLQNITSSFCADDMSYKMSRMMVGCIPREEPTLILTRTGDPKTQTGVAKDKSTDIGIKSARDRIMTRGDKILISKNMTAINARIQAPMTVDIIMTLPVIQSSQHSSHGPISIAQDPIRPVYDVVMTRDLKTLHNQPDSFYLHN